MKSRLLYILTILLIGQTQAQVDTTYSYSTVRRVNSVDFEKDTLRSTEIDTSLATTQLYYITQKQDVPYANLGNYGSAAIPLFFSVSKGLGFKLLKNPFEVYYTNDRNLDYFRTKSPFTTLSFTLGSRLEQNLHVIHTQNVTKNWNVGINFRRQIIDGFYQNQKTDFLEFDAHTWYQTNNNRYNLLTAFVLNRNKIKENGGVTNFQSITGPDLAGVNLQATTRGVIDRNIYVEQYLNFGTIKPIVNDSITINYVEPKVRLVHKFHYHNEIYQYKELPTQVDFYANNYDSTHTSDYVAARTLTNSLSLVHLPQKGLYWEVMAQNDAVKLPANTLIKEVNNSLVGAKLGLSDHDKQNIFVSYKYVFLGAHKMDDLFETKYTFNAENVSFIAGYWFNQQLPTYQSQYLFSNHFRWQNNFVQEKKQNAYGKLGFTKPHIYLTAQLQSVYSLLYFNALGKPTQSPKPVHVSTFMLDKTFKLGRFGFKNQLIYSNILQGKAIVRNPNFYYFGSVYFEKEVFKKVLRLHPGIDIRYIPSYNSYNYIPSTMQFASGTGYVMPFTSVDAYISAKLKRTRSFLKMENISNGWFGNNEAFIVNYPIQPLTLRIGVNWDFFN